MSQIRPNYPGIEKTEGARVCIAWDIENVRCPSSGYGDINRVLTALQNAFTLNGRRKIDEILVVHKQRTTEITKVLPVLEKDPSVTCITVNNTWKSDFVADDILRGKIERFLDRLEDYTCPGVLVLMSGDSGFDMKVRQAMQRRCHVEILYEYGTRSPLSVGLGNWACEWLTFLESWGVRCSRLCMDRNRPAGFAAPPSVGDAAFTPVHKPSVEAQVVALLGEKLQDLSFLRFCAGEVSDADNDEDAPPGHAANGRCAKPAADRRARGRRATRAARAHQRTAAASRAAAGGGYEDRENHGAAANRSPGSPPRKRRAAGPTPARKQSTPAQPHPAKHCNRPHAPPSPAPSNQSKPSDPYPPAPLRTSVPFVGPCRSDGAANCHTPLPASRGQPPRLSRVADLSTGEIVDTCRTLENNTRSPCGAVITLTPATAMDTHTPIWCGTAAPSPATLKPLLPASPASAMQTGNQAPMCRALFAERSLALKREPRAAAEAQQHTSGAVAASAAAAAPKCLPPHGTQAPLREVIDLITPEPAPCPRSAHVDIETGEILSLSPAACPALSCPRHVAPSDTRASTARYDVSQLPPLPPTPASSTPHAPHENHPPAQRRSGRECTPSLLQPLRRHASEDLESGEIPPTPLSVHPDPRHTRNTATQPKADEPLLRAAAESRPCDETHPPRSPALASSCADYHVSQLPPLPPSPTSARDHDCSEVPTHGTATTEASASPAAISAAVPQPQPPLPHPRTPHNAAASRPAHASPVNPHSNTQHTLQQGRGNTQHAECASQGTLAPPAPAAAACADAPPASHPASPPQLSSSPLMCPRTHTSASVLAPLLPSSRRILAPRQPPAAPTAALAERRTSATVPNPRRAEQEAGKLQPLARWNWDAAPAAMGAAQPTASTAALTVGAPHFNRASHRVLRKLEAFQAELESGKYDVRNVLHDASSPQAKGCGSSRDALLQMLGERVSFTTSSGTASRSHKRAHTDAFSLALPDCNAFLENDFPPLPPQPPRRYAALTQQRAVPAGSANRGGTMDSRSCQGSRNSRAKKPDGNTQERVVCAQQ